VIGRLLTKLVNEKRINWDEHLSTNFFSYRIAYKVAICHNPSLGLATKAKACKSASQEGSPGVTFHAPASANEPSHSQGNSHFGSWSPSELPNLQKAIAGVKIH
jgi:hypothetical protein